jgi:hypothetical protein
MKIPRKSEALRVPRPAASFTLIELTLVTFLLLTLIGLSIPLFKKTLSGLSAQDTSFNISKLVNYAQEIAVLERKNFKITFNFQGGKYQLLEIVPSVKPAPPKKIPGRFGRSFSLPQGLKLSGDRKDVLFYQDGHCDAFTVKVLAKEGGYSIRSKGFGNMVEVKEVQLE